MLDFSKKIYVKLCCGFDTILQAAFKHEKSTTKREGNNFILDGINLSTTVRTTNKGEIALSDNVSNVPTYLHTPHSDHDEKVPSFGTDSNKVSIIANLNIIKQPPATDLDINIYRDFSSASAIMNTRINNKHVKSESDGLNIKKFVDPLPLANSRFNMCNFFRGTFDLKVYMDFI
eukprot:497122_1